jgi:FHA domain-containing protein
MRRHTVSTVPAARRTGALQLLVIDDVAMEQHALPDRGTIVIGRSSQADLQLEHREVSRRHLELTLGRRIRVRDLGSRNGIEVAGKPIGSGEETTVGLGEPIAIGALTLVVQRAVEPGSGDTILIDRSAHEVRRSQTKVSLAKRPIVRKLLYALASGEACGKEPLVRGVWNVEYHPLRHDNVLRVAIHQLRALLAPIGVKVEFDDDAYRLVVPREAHLRVSA